MLRAGSFQMELMKVTKAISQGRIIGNLYRCHKYQIASMAPYKKFLIHQHVRLYFSMDITFVSKVVLILYKVRQTLIPTSIDPQTLDFSLKSRSYVV